MRKAVGCVLVLAMASVAFGTVIYNNEPDFLKVIQPGYYLEDFPTWTYGNPYTNLIQTTDADFGPVNGWTWHAHADLDLWSNFSSLSTNNAYDPLVITFPTQTPEVTAVAGIFSATDFNGNNIPYNVIITLADATSVTITGQGFRGFTSAMPIVSMTVDGDDSQVPNWPQVDHLYVGSAIPEPASLLLLGVGAGFLARRRRRR